MPDNQRPQRDEPNLLEKGLRSILPDISLDVDGVIVSRGWVYDTYHDDKGNKLHDVPWWGNDKIECRNGAVPSSAQVRRALNQLQHDGQPTYEGSNTLLFTGTNPIAAACAIAPRPARAR